MVSANYFLRYLSSAKKPQMQLMIKGKIGSTSGAFWAAPPLDTTGSHPSTLFRCVDPLDGTKEFIKRNGEFTVNIGLCHLGAPIAGVVYCPATTPPLMYKAVKGDGPPIREECDAIGGRRMHACNCDLVECAGVTL
jgi:3'-phosphoadenosine 5'-phosphosulfate (PAPS) 3'-phosphatase